jgi:hypothetical protein
MIETYLQKAEATEKQGDAREESYYPAFKTLLEKVAEKEGQPDAHVTVLPKRTEAGNPDVRVWDGHGQVTGYVEAKRPGADLGTVEESEQLERYREAFPNVILTDFYEFRLYRDGERVARAGIEADSLQSGDDFARLMEQFFAFSQPQALTAEELAVVLAKRTRFLEHVILGALRAGDEEEASRLRGFYEAFSTHLITGLTREQFADLYAQTVAYGLFAARSRIEDAEDFTRRTAAEHIPPTVGILREVFEYISFGGAPQQVEVVVDDIAGVLRSANIGGILKTYFREGKGEDPILHFYETFLAEYDPALRERRGVYYTPQPVVGYIVRSVDHLLTEVFDRADGLADRDVTVLDPAAGTLTFIAEAFRQAVDTFTDRYGTGGRETFVQEHLMQNFYAFELMMAPYAIGHLKTGYILDELGHGLTEDERFPLYLTNTLEMEDIEQTDLPGMDSLSQESRDAGAVKKEQPVLAVMGNPPYSGISSNMGEWIVDKIEDYKYVNGEHFGERKHWLHDDYVKFIRFAQWKIERRDRGLVAFITNHGFLDNPTFRGMRQSLMESFDQIHVLNLHGNSNKKEKAPDGSADANVFDIQQGVAISLFVKKPGLEKKVCRADLRSSDRKEKYDWLDERDVRSTEWKELRPQSPFYFFTERDYELEEGYRRFTPLPEIFPENVTGIITSRDSFVIDSDEDDLQERIERFRDLDQFSDDEIRTTYDLNDTRGWEMKEARRILARKEDWEKHFTKLLYRPFDPRHIYYSPDMVDWGREGTMRHMVGHENTALISPKQFKEEPGAFITEHITGHKTVSAYDINYLFPLYRYPQAEKRDLFSQQREDGERVANLNDGIWDTLAAAYGERPAPDAVLHYVYAVLYAPTYRSTYAEFLKTDFPKIPFPADHELFQRLAEKGEKLAALHLMKSDALKTPTAQFHGEGSGVVAKPKRVGRDYRPEEERVYINNDGQHFGPIPPEVWNYQIGGYQVLDKWLYDRREKDLTVDEIEHYCRVATALGETIRLQEEIDAAYPGVEEQLLSVGEPSDA